MTVQQNYEYTENELKFLALAKESEYSIKTLQENENFASFDIESVNFEHLVFEFMIEEKIDFVVELIAHYEKCVQFKEVFTQSVV